MAEFILNLWLLFDHELGLWSEGWCLYHLRNVDKFVVIRDEQLFR
jgi:hypothetical protein